MRRFPFILTLYATLLIGCCLIGCGGSSDEIVDDVAQKDGSKPASPKISEVESYLPPLDEGRVKIAPPKGWHTLPRNSKFLVRFTRKKGISYPAIIVTVKQFDEIGEVTDKNINEYAKLLDSPGDNLERRRIKDFVGVSYTKQGVLKEGVRTTLVDRKFIETVVDHRRYQYELWTKEGELDRFTPDLLAVAARTQFLNREGVETLEDLDADESTESPSPEKAESPDAFATPAPKPKPAPTEVKPKAEPPKVEPPKAEPPKIEAPKEEAPKEVEKKQTTPTRRRRRTSAFE